MKFTTGSKKPFAISIRFLNHSETCESFFKTCWSLWEFLKPLNNLWNYLNFVEGLFITKRHAKLSKDANIILGFFKILSLALWIVFWGFLILELNKRRKHFFLPNKILKKYDLFSLRYTSYTFGKLKLFLITKTAHKISILWFFLTFLEN